uniref:Uncharacterized protein n=1 Tax=Anopheles coluzzii TaxID=1518534 RepID=A0A8W7NZB6_ANOCL
MPRGLLAATRRLIDRGTRPHRHGGQRGSPTNTNATTTSTTVAPLPHGSSVRPECLAHLPHEFFCHHFSFLLPDYGCTDCAFHVAASSDGGRNTHTALAQSSKRVRHRKKPYNMLAASERHLPFDLGGYLPQPIAK